MDVIRNTPILCKQFIVWVVDSVRAAKQVLWPTSWHIEVSNNLMNEDKFSSLVSVYFISWLNTGDTVRSWQAHKVKLMTQHTLHVAEQYREHNWYNVLCQIKHSLAFYTLELQKPLFSRMWSFNAKFEKHNQDFL